MGGGVGCVVVAFFQGFSGNSNYLLETGSFAGNRVWSGESGKLTANELPMMRRLSKNIREL